MLDILKKAIRIKGGVQPLAHELGVHYTGFYKWPEVPPKHVGRLSAITGEPYHKIRPDIFPPPKIDFPNSAER